MKPAEPFRHAIRDLVATLDPTGISWAVAGAVAANHYRDKVRVTMDLDVLLSLTDSSVDVVIDALQKEHWSAVELMENWLIRARHPVAGLLDILVSGTEYETGAIARAQHVRLDSDHTYRTLAVEDVLILKLIANRFQDDADVESILLTNPELDWDYMSRWFEEFGLEQRFERIEDAAIAGGRLTDKISRNSPP